MIVAVSITTSSAVILVEQRYFWQISLYNVVSNAEHSFGTGIYLMFLILVTKIPRKVQTFSLWRILSRKGPSRLLTRSLTDKVKASQIDASV